MRRIRAAWYWLRGLRVSTERQRQDVDDFWARSVRAAVRGSKQAHAEKREAQRLLVLLSEPLKDWDLADFPELDSRSLLHTLTQEDSRHLSRVLEGYRLVAGPVAQIRMGATANDQTRQRGWADQPLPYDRPRIHLDPKRLP